MTALSVSRPLHSLQLLLTHSDYFTLVAIALLLADAVFCYGIINYISYTEIDWTTYMQQIRLYLNGETNYSLIKGSTGPLVYPAGFLYVYSALYHLTDQGRNIKRAQYLFAGVYLLTQGMVFAIYKRCRSIPPYVLILMTFSKRLHSIYVLRLFNDGITMLFFYVAILAWTNRKRSWLTGSILFSLALSIKMSIILVFPALLYLYLINLGTTATLLHSLLIVAIQLLLATPFIVSHPAEYINGAFNFSRQFTWEWTVNWRWVGEKTFSSQELSRGLLLLHFVGLLLLLYKWTEPDGGVVRVMQRGLRYPNRPAAKGGNVSSNDRIVTLLFTCNLLGIICARSLHYQFYAWYAHQVAFLLWRTRFNLVTKILIAVTIEICWNVFPSTIVSSFTLCGANLILLLSVYCFRRKRGKAKTK